MSPSQAKTAHKKKSEYYMSKPTNASYQKRNAAELFGLFQEKNCCTFVTNRFRYAMDVAILWKYSLILKL